MFLGGCCTATLGSAFGLNSSGTETSTFLTGVNCGLSTFTGFVSILISVCSTFGFSTVTGLSKVTYLDFIFSRI
ncbi:MAG: hypothetical protein IJ332_02130 [Clostridia bacterium]|nr:hypothetical protein [Clostridia bacterium]